MRPSTELRVVLDPGDLARRRVCLFVCYSPDYLLKPHVRLHMAALKAHGFDIVYILVIDAFANRRLAVPINFLSGMIARRNAGFDFGAWADAFRVLPTLWSAERVLLVNDSVFGPIGDFGAMVKRLLSQTADIVGLTESPEYQRHFQSFFLMLQHGALRRREARAYWEGLTNLADKLAVVQQYEVKLLQLHYQWGLAGAALFPWQAGPDPAQANPTLSQWRALLARGFPYLKVQLLRDNPAGADLTGWREVVGDPALLAAIDAEIMRGAPPRMDGA